MYLGCLDLYFGCLALYLGVWTCIWVSGLVFWVSTHHPVVYDPACGMFCFFWKTTPLFVLNTHIVNLLNFHKFEPPLCFFQKVGNLSKWLCQQDAHRFSVLGAGLNAPICFFPTRNLGEFLDFANLGLNVNLKNRGHPKP